MKNAATEKQEMLEEFAKVVKAGPDDPRYQEAQRLLDEK
jgi:hypothetical protein